MSYPRKLIVTALIAALPAIAAHAELAASNIKGEVIQRLEAFDNPEGSIFSADGKYVLVTNSAELGMQDKGFNWIEKGGYISKLEVQADGTLKMVNDKLVTGLTGPLGMGVLPVATGKFPAGTIFVCQSAAPMATADGTPVKDQSRMDPKLLAIDIDGKILGAISLGAKAPLASLSGAPATLPNALGFDKEGNLYFADSGIGGAAFDPPVQTKPGLYMISHGAIDELADGKAPTQPVAFIGMPGIPDGVEVDGDGNIHTNTVGPAIGADDPAKGGMYKLTKDDFKAGKLPAPFASDLGALDGLDFAGKLRLDTEIKNTNSVTVTGADGKPARLTLNQDIKMAGPADIAVHKMADGSYLLIIPELSAVTPNAGKNPVTVVKLPAGIGD
ncbi:MAG: hypothetical protein U1F68_07705 [Gammaproteobacteria bacterium]